ncbi:Phage Holliday junction resolvase [Streptococcus macedonicus]|nr:Phage Holliday junction resolvase [Streptococcus macedonicus]
MYEDPKMMKWRKQVTDYIKENYDGRYFDGAIRVEVTFYMKAPQNVSKKPSERSKDKAKQLYSKYISERLWHVKKPDSDNLIKSLFDSISKSEIVWSDDNIVCDLRARKLYSPNPRIEIEIEEIE